MTLNETQAGIQADLRRHSGMSLPDFIVVQMDNLLAQEPLWYLDAKITSTGGSGLERRVAGRIVGFTERRVILVEMSETPMLPGASDSVERTVTAATWSRAQLRAVSLQGTDQRWESPESAFPTGTYVQLTYEGRSELLDLPIAAEAIRPRSDGELERLVRTLLLDLG